MIDIIVTEAYRKKGIGSQLIKVVKQWGKSRRLDYIELFVLSDAQGEIVFYEHENFQAVSHTMRCPL